MNKLFTIGQAAEESGLTPDTIRYYERVGVLPAVGRDSNSYRGYPAEHVEVLRFARRLRELGLAPGAMTSLIRLFHDGTCQQMRDALLENCERTLSRARAQRLELERVESQLSIVIEGLEQLDMDENRIATVTPCPCAAVIEQSSLLTTGVASPG